MQRAPAPCAAGAAGAASTAGRAGQATAASHHAVDVEQAARGGGARGAAKVLQHAREPDDGDEGLVVVLAPHHAAPPRAEKRGESSGGGGRARRGLLSTAPACGAEQRQACRHTHAAVAHACCPCCGAPPARQALCELGHRCCCWRRSGWRVDERRRTSGGDCSGELCCLLVRPGNKACVCPRWLAHASRGQEVGEVRQG